MQILLILPRLLLLIVLLTLGPFMLFVGLVVLSNGNADPDVWKVFIGIGAIFSLAFYITNRSDILKPTERLANKANEMVTAVSESTSKALTAQREKADVAKRLAVKKQAFIDNVIDRSACTPIKVIILGGAGWENQNGREFLLSMDEAVIYMSDLTSETDTTINIYDLKEIEISGPGTVSKNAGLIGGGFGIEGAVKGIAAASIVNFLTTSNNTKTFIRLTFEKNELIMLTSQIEPDKARILLSPLFLKINNKSEVEISSGLSKELQNLFNLKQIGAITDEEYESLKKNLII